MRQQLESALADPSSTLCPAVLRTAELLLFCADAIALETLVWAHFPPPPATASVAPYRSSALPATLRAWRSLLPSPLTEEEAVAAEGSYRTDAEARLKVLRSQTEGGVVQPPAHGAPSARPPGPLLSAVLARVAQWTDLEMEDYVVITSLCSVLAAHPHPAVHALLVDPAGALFPALKQVLLMHGQRKLTRGSSQIRRGQRAGSRRTLRCKCVQRRLL